MAKQRIHILIGPLLLLCLSLTRCSPYPDQSCQLSPPYTQRSHSSGNLGRTMGEETFAFDVGAGQQNTSLRLEFEVDRGTAAWRYLDPSGEIRWQGSIEAAGRITETRQFDPLPGQWTLYISGQASAGAYDVCWLAE